ncbi:MAG: Cu(I)-responsive transcriptional regulator [Rhodospirillales bacterium]|jgi:MerR family copper efflux transcriptional regulator|nr:Cu(I)-responsive transcriptional regulator [Rhodospirillales bacterium]
MNIGAAAEMSGVSAKTIRYYEEIGLVPQALRRDNGYRHYEQTDIETLRFIQHARHLGFSVGDVAKLLSLWRDKHRASAEVKSLALRHIAEIEGRIAELKSMRRTLVHLSDRCHGDDRPDCPILDDLAGIGKND